MQPAIWGLPIRWIDGAIRLKWPHRYPMMENADCRQISFIKVSQCPFQAFLALVPDRQDICKHFARTSNCIQAPATATIPDTMAVKNHANGAGRLRVAIIGGGPGGLGAAIALAKLPFVDWTLYEKKPEISETGGGISLQLHTWKMLEWNGAAKNIQPNDFFRAPSGISGQYRLVSASEEIICQVLTIVETGGRVSCWTRALILQTLPRANSAVDKGEQSCRPPSSRRLTSPGSSSPRSWWTLRNFLVEEFSSVSKMGIPTKLTFL